MSKGFKQFVILTGLLLSIIAVVARPAKAQARDCDSILTYGVFDVENISDESKVISAAFNWMRQIGYTNIQQAIDGGIKFPGMSFGGGVSASNTSLYNAEILIRNTADSRRAFSSSVKQASKTIVDAWSKCMEGAGFNLSMFNTYNPREFRLILKFNPIGTMTKATLNEHPVIPPGIKCEPQGVLRKDSQIDFNGKQLLCTRNTDNAVSIVLNTDAGNKNVDLREIPKPPKFKSLEASDLIKLRCGNCAGDWWLHGVPERTVGQEQVTLSNDRDSVRNVWKVTIISNGVIALLNNSGGKWLHGVPDRPDGTPIRSEDFSLVQLSNQADSARNQWLVQYSIKYEQEGVLTLKFNASAVSGNYWLAGCPTATMKVCYATDAGAGEWEVEFVRLNSALKPFANLGFNLLHL